MRNRDANFIASTTIKVVAAAFKKVSSVLKTLSPSKGTTSDDSPIVPTFADISHFRSFSSHNTSSVVSDVFNHNSSF